jgi:PAS domain S-box-containing protein
MRGLLAEELTEIVCIMLEKLSDQIRTCHENAADAKQQAEAVADPALKASFLDLEKRWLALAQNYAPIESVRDHPGPVPDGQLKPERARANKSLQLQEINTLLIQEGNLAARQAADLVERTQIEQRFRWLASIVESSDDAIIGESLDGIIMSWNNGAQRLYGYTVEETVGKPITILIPPDRYHEERSIIERIKRGERIDHYETIRQRKDGSSVNVSLTGSPVKNAEGEIIGASRIARDITERKRAEAREKVLMAELDHRVKNVLARVAMVMMSSRHSSNSIDEFTQSLSGRINAMAAAHALLSKGRWHGVGLDGLVRNQLAPYVTDANIIISGTDVMLPPVGTQAMAMVLHELVTNAAKYGALSVPSGRVLVSWERRANGHAAANLVFVWRELGGPPTATEVQSGYGTRLIRELVPYDLGGTVDLQFAATGVSCKIELPLMQV